MEAGMLRGGCGIGTMLYISGKTINKFQYTWIAIIGEMYELIAMYLRNGSNRNLLAI